MTGRASRDRLAAFVGLSILVHGGLLLLLLEVQLGARPRPPLADAVAIEVVTLLPPAPEPVAEPEPTPPVAAPPPPPEPVRPPVAEPLPTPAPGKPAPEPVAPPEPAPPSPAVAEPEPTPEPVTETVLAAPPAVSALAPSQASIEDEIAAYAAKVRRMIAEHKRYPAMARRRGMEAMVTIRLRIADDGTIEEFSPLGSVPRFFEKATRLATEAAAPFPKPPEGFGTLELGIRYELDE